MKIPSVDSYLVCWRLVRVAMWESFTIYTPRSFTEHKYQDRPWYRILHSYRTGLCWSSPIYTWAKIAISKIFIFSFLFSFFFTLFMKRESALKNAKTCECRKSYIFFYCYFTYIYEAFCAFKCLKCWLFPCLECV